MTSNSFRSTIRYDEEIARWALRLLAHKPVRTYFSSSSRAKEIKMFLLFHVFIMLVNLSVAGYILKAGLSYKPYDGIWIFLSLAAAYLIEIPYKNLLADNVTAFVQSEFSEEDLKKITIVQMSVRLEKKYQAPELIDTVSGWMSIFRYGLVFLYAFLLLIFIPFTQASLIILSVAWAARALSRSSILADRIVPVKVV